jgi:hypothetical protein
MTTDDEPRVLLVLLALAIALWLAGQILATSGMDPKEPGASGLARGGDGPSPAPPAQR